MKAVRPLSCESARLWASQRADEEVSELEAARLERHLARCPACAVFADRMDVLAAALRAAPLAWPSPSATRVPARRPAPQPRRRLVRQAALVLAAGAAAALVVAVAVPAPRSVSIGWPHLEPDNGAAELDAARLVVAMSRLGPAPAWPGHGAST